MTADTSAQTFVFNKFHQIWIFFNFLCRISSLENPFQHFLFYRSQIYCQVAHIFACFSISIHQTFSFSPVESTNGYRLGAIYWILDQFFSAWKRFWRRRALKQPRIGRFYYLILQLLQLSALGETIEKEKRSKLMSKRISVQSHQGRNHEPRSKVV